MAKLCTEVFQPVSVFATPLVPTSSSPPPPSSPVISVRDVIYEYGTVGTLHSQTHADTQDTVEYQTIRQRQKKEEKVRHNLIRILRNIKQ